MLSATRTCRPIAIRVSTSPSLSLFLSFSLSLFLSFSLSLSRRHPQTAYAGFFVLLQLEWQYICRAVPGVEAHLQQVEGVIVGKFIPALLDIQPGELTPTLRCLLGHRVKQGDMNLRNPVESAGWMRQVSVEGSKVLVALLLGGKELNCEQDAVSVRAASKEARKKQVEAETAYVDKLKAAAPRNVRKRYERSGKNVSWLIVRPDILGGILLSRQEFVDNAQIRLNLKVLDIRQNFDGCGAGFSVNHTLSCKRADWFPFATMTSGTRLAPWPSWRFLNHVFCTNPSSSAVRARGLGGGNSGGVQQQRW